MTAAVIRTVQFRRDKNGTAAPHHAVAYLRSQSDGFDRGLSGAAPPKTLRFRLLPLSMQPPFISTQLSRHPRLLPASPTDSARSRSTRSDPCRLPQYPLPNNILKPIEYAANKQSQCGAERGVITDARPPPAHEYLISMRSANGLLARQGAGRAACSSSTRSNETSGRPLSVCCAGVSGELGGVVRSEGGDPSTSGRCCRAADASNTS